MSKKLSYEFIKEQFEKEGYKLLSANYVNSSKKLEYICPNGHGNFTTYTNWYTGHRCPYCDGQGKPSIEFIRDEFNREGYNLMSDEYKNCYSKLNYVCNNGHLHNIGWNSWQQGHRCPYCNKRTPIDINFVKNNFEREGYGLLTDFYTNANQRLDYICRNGHEGNISWRNWYYTKNRCPECYYLSITGKSHYNWRNGKSFEPYGSDFTRRLRKSILERDNHQCQNPNCLKIIKKLSIHHIDYDKENCDPSNLITLCVSCNSRANFKRDYWIDFYKGIIKKKILIKEVFNYVCYYKVG